MKFELFYFWFIFFITFLVFKNYFYVFPNESLLINFDKLEFSILKLLKIKILIVSFILLLITFNEKLKKLRLICAFTLTSLLTTHFFEILENSDLLINFDFFHRISAMYTYIIYANIVFIMIYLLFLNFNKFKFSSNYIKIIFVILMSISISTNYSLFFNKFIEKKKNTFIALEKLNIINSDISYVNINKSVKSLNHSSIYNIPLKDIPHQWEALVFIKMYLNKKIIHN